MWRGRDIVRPARRALHLGAALALLSCVSAEPPPLAARPAPDAPFGFRDPRDGRSANALTPRQARGLAEALAALRGGEVPRADQLARAGLASASDRAPFQVALAYVSLAAGDFGAARERLGGILEREPDHPAALEADGDAAHASGRLREALDRYRRALRALPDDARLSARVTATRTELFRERRQEAEAALSSGELESARRAGLSLVDLDAAAPDGYRVLSRAAEAGGKLEDAFLWAEKARVLAPSDAGWTASVAELAARTGRHPRAAELWESLGRTGEFREKAERARLQFRVQNLPEAARQAALSPRLTRGQFAVLSYWTVPETREAPDALVPEVAVDVVDHPDRTALVKAIALGFFGVGKETHRMAPDTALTRAEMGPLLRRLAAVVAGGPAPKGCLAPDSPTLAALAECGILPEAASRNVSGEEALKAIERAARVGREGGLR